MTTKWVTFERWSQRYCDKTLTVLYDWITFELIDTKEIGENRFQIVVRQRGERTFEELASNLMGKLKLEAIEKRLPSMQEVFLELIAKEEVKNEE